MGIKIVDFMHNPDEFSLALLDIFKCCFYDIADKIQLNPFLGEYTTPERKIITCTSDDFKRMAGLAELNTNWFLNHYYQVAKFGKTFVALHGKNIIGGTNVQIKRGRNGKIAFTSQLYVHPSFQGQKIGYTLVKMREKYAKEVLGLNITENECLVYRPTLDFYSKNGHRFKKVIKYHYHDSLGNLVFPNIRMRKIL